MSKNILYGILFGASGSLWWGTIGVIYFKSSSFSNTKESEEASNLKFLMLNEETNSNANPIIKITNDLCDINTAKELRALLNILYLRFPCRLTQMYQTLRFC